MLRVELTMFRDGKLMLFITDCFSPAVSADDVDATALVSTIPDVSNAVGVRPSNRA